MTAVPARYPAEAETCAGAGWATATGESTPRSRDEGGGSRPEGLRAFAICAPGTGTGPYPQDGTALPDKD